LDRQIVIEQDKNERPLMYPARVTYRGFSEESITKAYKKLATYMNENVKTLKNEM